MHSLPVRLILWTFAMAYGGFLLAGRGTRALDRNTISEVLIWAVLGCLIAVMLTLRARRRHV